jgi:hypothetical protein
MKIGARLMWSRASGNERNDPRGIELAFICITSLRGRLSVQASFSLIGLTECSKHSGGRYSSTVNGVKRYRLIKDWSVWLHW